MRKINKVESKKIFLRGWFRFLRSVDRAKKNRPRQEKNGSLRFADETTPVQNQVATFIEKISIINEYDSSILRRDAERILIPKYFDLYDNPEKSLLFISAATKLIARGKRKSYLFDYKKNKKHCLGLECLLGVALTAARQSNINFKDTMIQINGVYPKDEQYLEIIRDIGLVKEISNADPGKVLDSTEASKKNNPKKRIFLADSIGKESASAFAHDKKNLTAEKFTAYINKCLNDHSLKLVQDAEKHLTSCMGELLDNAERHCGLEQRPRWYLRGFVNNNVRNPICELAVFNFGKTICETFDDLPDDHFSLSKQVKPYINKHINKKGMFKEGLTTVAALQGRVSCKNEKETDSSGTGTIELLKLFQDMHDSLKKMGRDVKGGIKMTLISGSTHINFDGSYNLKKRLVNDEESDIFTYPFNDVGLESEPDRTYLKRMKDARFPGVMINIRFPLPENATQRT
ncbi:hypothetical protein M8N47_09005 [Enterobacter hormaechei]|uniref:hypothetical protein n=1 Tax=Enterobacter hormaechei TaxID=158836 RepID=UPI001CB10665|nr:hypothetical protein [Enterobacter hormaechei]MBB8776901.1 hypothetical protein [Escherichia coli]HBI6867500.1 hypothetical protein [Enterobacter cancerogenus]HDT1799850.1 hypothetical protein [Enterobacter hormaechei subsp. xiangfangensis]MCM7251279.1 hypothetical protein [Enterobacter hormaechei]MCM7311665.1 hypothetical protein [Enterobacter hormaechei]